MRGKCAAAIALSALAAMQFGMWAGCTPAPRYTRSSSAHHRAQRGRHRLSGIASYYGRTFHRKKTASGERFNMYAFTAAHKTLPFGTRVKVTNVENGRSVIVRINDRGPHKKGRVLDLSLGAARKIGMVSAGTARVRIKILR
jgi:rare lipoprotein A (peptidoglycan hydrolase)